MFRLNDNQLKQLAEFVSNLSLIFFASVITPLFSEIDKLTVFTVLWGIGLGLGSLAISILILRRRII